MIAAGTGSLEWLGEESTGADFGDKRSIAV